MHVKRYQFHSFFLTKLRQMKKLNKDLIYLDGLWLPEHQILKMASRAGSFSVAEHFLCAYLVNALLNGNRNAIHNVNVIRTEYHLNPIPFTEEKDGDISGELLQATSAELPTMAEMAMACETTRDENLWWGHSSWSVVFRIYEILGFKGSARSFIEEVKDWPLKEPFPYHCDKDSVGKPLRRGKILGPIEKWATEGAHQREVKLGNRLLALLS